MLVETQHRPTRVNRSAGSPYRNVLKKLTPEEFSQRFATIEQCLDFLATEKWARGFVCRKCGHTHYCSGKTPFSRRCTRCKAEESATSHTIFHSCKIDLPAAFQMLYTVCHQPDISTYQLSALFALRQMTCCKFKQKITKCLESGHFDWLTDIR